MSDKKETFATENNSETQKRIKLLGYIKITGEIEALTGLHIGGTADSIDKGGIDNPVIKNPVTNEPYIPGSSLRGRIRSLLEKRNALLHKNELSEMATGIWMEIYIKEEDALKSEVCRLFGNSASEKSVPSVLIVRDALLSKQDTNDYRREDYVKNGLPVTEAKMEIAVDRITAHAVPRTIERVPAGAKFEFEIIYKVQTYENGEFEKESSDYGTKSDEKLRVDLKNILWALEQIETHDGLGGNTSRGHGQVNICINGLEDVHFLKQETQESKGESSEDDVKTADEVDCEKMKKSFSDWCQEINKICYSKDLQENNSRQPEEPEKI